MRTFRRAMRTSASSTAACRPSATTPWFGCRWLNWASTASWWECAQEP